jgi:DNA-directed RNA polymerase specialized sigma24 family protein
MTPIEPGSQKPADDSQDALFSQRATSAWGIAFVTTEAVTTATDAVADGFAELFQEIENGTKPDDTHFEALRLTRAAATRILDAGPGGRHSREPVSLLGETKDRQATLALTALTEPARSILWLIEAEHLGLEQTAQIMELPTGEIEFAIRQARSDFRRYYVDATKRDGLQYGCRETLELLAAYSNQTLNAGEKAPVEAHLATCDACRSVTTKLSDLESRLQAAIPSIPAWTRQYVMDTWEAISTHEHLTNLDSKRRLNVPLLSRTAAMAVAGVAVITAITIGLVFPAADKDENRETTSSQLAAPTASTTTTISNATPDDDEPSVATPSFRSATAEESTNAATGNNIVSTADSSNAMATSAMKPTVTTAVVPTTTTLRKISDTTAPPVEQDESGNVLLDLPSVPAPTTTTTTRSRGNGT